MIPDWRELKEEEFWVGKARIESSRSKNRQRDAKEIAEIHLIG